MKPTHNPKGFTLIEVVVVLALIGGIIAVSTGLIDYSSWFIKSRSDALTADLNYIDLGYVNFVNEKGYAASPGGLSDAAFVPTYVATVPAAPAGFDTSYGVNGYYMGSQATGTPGLDDWYVCAKAVVSGSSDQAYRAAAMTAVSLSSQKYFINTACPASANMAAPAGAATIYPTYWLTRHW